MSSGAYWPRPAALDHGRAAHADVRALGGDDHVAAAEQRGVAREAAARRDPDQRDAARSAGRRGGRPWCPGRTRPGRRCRPDARRRPPRRGRPAGAGARPARRGGPSCGGSGTPGSRPAPCSRRRRPRPVDRRCGRSRRPGRRRGCGRSGPRRRGGGAGRRWPEGPYSTKLSGSQRSAMFSRVVRWPVRRRRATASGRAGSRPMACRATTAARSARSPSSPASAASAVAATAPGSRVTSTSPARTASPTATRSSTTVPSISAATTCSIFMDSMTTSVAPAVTPVPAATGTPTTRPCRGDTTACTRSTLTTGPGPPVAVDRPVAGGGPVGQAGRRR